MSLSETELPPDERPRDLVRWYPAGRRHPMVAAEKKAVMLAAMGAAALGALTVGALSVGFLAVGRLAVGKAHIRELKIDRLVLGEIVPPKH